MRISKVELKSIIAFSALFIAVFVFIYFIWPHTDVGKPFYQEERIADLFSTTTPENPDYNQSPYTGESNNLAVSNNE